ncbi:Ribosome hibernation promoting factor [Streptomyces narbonensis]
MKWGEVPSSGNHRSLVQREMPCGQGADQGDPGTEFCVDIVVKGRKTEVPKRFRKHVAEKLKLEKIQKLDGKVISLDVEVSKEHNPRQATGLDLRGDHPPLPQAR